MTMHALGLILELPAQECRRAAVLSWPRYQAMLEEESSTAPCSREGTAAEQMLGDERPGRNERREKSQSNHVTNFPMRVLLIRP